MATAAHSVAVKVSGTAVSMTAEATTLVTGTTYQITNTAKRVLDPSVAVVVNDAGSPVSATVDYLFGTVTLASSPGGAVTVTASYLPVATIGECKSVDLSISIDLGDITSFDSAGVKKKTSLLQDISGSLGRLVMPIDDLDSATGGVQSIHSWMLAGTPRLIDVLFTSGARVRAWVLFKSYKVTGQTSSIVESTVEFEGSAQNSLAAFGIGT